MNECDWDLYAEGFTDRVNWEGHNIIRLHGEISIGDYSCLRAHFLDEIGRQGGRVMNHSRNTGPYEATESITASARTEAFVLRGTYDRDTAKNVSIAFTRGGRATACELVVHLGEISNGETPAYKIGKEEVNVPKL